MAALVPFTIDLTAHEGTRLAAVLDALGPLWDPAEIDTGEAQAHRMLYAHLDHWCPRAPDDRSRRRKG